MVVSNGMFFAVWMLLGVGALMGGMVVVALTSRGLRLVVVDAPEAVNVLTLPSTTLAVPEVATQGVEPLAG